jgi:carboxymethylenebutenolidase
MRDSLGVNEKEDDMCYDTDARPPLPPISGGAGLAGMEDLTLQAADGNRLLAYSARAEDSDAPGIVVLPDVRGLHPFYKDLAVRFAEAGVHATAIDYFGRTAGSDERGDDFDFKAHTQQTTPEGLRTDVEAGIAHVRSGPGGGARRVFTVGFCFGGRVSFSQAAHQDLDGVIGFYGRPRGSGPDDPEAPLKLVGRYDCPVLGLFGGADHSIPLEDVELFRRALDEAGVRNDLVAYDGAPHSFFDRSFSEHKEACDDAWRRVLTFIGA